VVGGNDRERQLRLLRRLSAELQERRLAMSGQAPVGMEYPIVVTMLDNYGAFADSYGDPGDMQVHTLVARLVADGPGVGMMTIISAKHAADIPTRVASLVASRLVLRLADRYDYSGLGVPPVDPPTTPGRGFEAGTGREVQVALPHRDGLAAAVAANPWSAPITPPWSIDVLPSDIPIAEFISAARISPDEWFLPLGIGDSSLVPVGLVLRDGDHALITGPPRSGKTTALATIATVAKAASPDIHVAAVLPRRSPLSRCDAVDQFIDVDDLATAGAVDRSWLLLVDDAELVDARSPLRNLLDVRHPQVRVVASGAADAIRGLYGHWTQDLRRSRIGCALRPNTVADGDLWQTQLPRHPHQQFPVGRGYLLANGQAELVQLGRS
jgi:S-DNA-T family DNA segregation ATPase FtsK/SpoIIIE